MAISRSTNRTTGSYGKGAGSLQSRKRKNGQSSTLTPEELQAAVAPPVANPAAMAGRPAFVSSSSQPQQPGLADTPQIAQPVSNIDPTSLVPSASPPPPPPPPQPGLADTPQVTTTTGGGTGGADYYTPQVVQPQQPGLADTPQVVQPQQPGLADTPQIVQPTRLTADEILEEQRLLGAVPGAPTQPGLADTAPTVEDIMAEQRLLGAVQGAPAQPGLADAPLTADQIMAEQRQEGAVQGAPAQPGLAPNLPGGPTNEALAGALAALGGGPQQPGLADTPQVAATAGGGTGGADYYTSQVVQPQQPGLAPYIEPTPQPQQPGLAPYIPETFEAAVQPSVIPGGAADFTATGPRQAGTLESALEQQALARLTGADPAEALLRSQYEEQAADIERQTIEDLQRYGVLRGGGDTADVLGSLRGELAQGRLGIEAELDRRRQAAMQQAMQLRQLQAGQEESAAERGLREGMAVGRVGGADTLAAQELAQRGGQIAGAQSLAERQLSQQDRQFAAELAERGALTREQLAQQGRQFGQGQQLAREQLTGQVALGGPSTGPTQSLAAQELAQRGGQFAAGQQLARDQMSQQARQFGQGQQLAREQLTGQVALGGPSTGPTESLAARQLDLGERGLEADIAARMAQMTGYIPSGGMGAPMTTLARQAQEAGITSQQLRDQLASRQVGLSEAELFGFDRPEQPGLQGRSTMAQRALAQDIAASEAAMGSQALRDELAEAQLYGFERTDQPGLQGRTTMAQRALAEDVAARQAQQELAGRQLDLSEAEVFGFDQPEQPGLQGRSTMRQRALAEDIAARQAQQDLAREEIYGGVADGPQTLRQQALAEDIAARQERGELAKAELYGGPEGEAQTLQQQLVESQLAGVPMDRAMMLTSQALAAREAGMDTLADTLEGMITGGDGPTGNGNGNGNGNDNGNAGWDPRAYLAALDTDQRLAAGTKFSVVEGEAINNLAIPPGLAKELGTGMYGIDKNGDIVNVGTGATVLTREELRNRAGRTKPVVT